MKVKDISIPSISIKDMENNLRKAQKFLHNVQHILKSPKAIKDIRKWQRQQEEQTKKIILFLSKILFLFEKNIDMIKRLHEHDKTLAHLLISEMSKDFEKRKLE